MLKNVVVKIRDTNTLPMAPSNIQATLRMGKDTDRASCIMTTGTKPMMEILRKVEFMAKVRRELSPKSI